MDGTRSGPTNLPLGVGRPAAPRHDVLRDVFRLAGPAIAQQLLYTLLFLTDRIMLGHHSAEALAAMQVGGPLIWTLFSVMGAFAAGTVAIVGRATGAGARSAANAATRASLMLAVALGLVTALATPLVPPLVALLFPEAGASVQAHARGYLSVAVPAMPVFLVGFVAASALQAAGDTRTPFLVSVAANLLNVGASWLFIYGELGAPELGAAGAALGSALAAALEMLVLLWLLGRADAPASWRGRGGEREALERILHVSRAALGERLVQHAGFMGYVVLIGWLGPLAMAANQALIAIESVAFLTADGLGIAAATIVSQRLGAERPDEAQRGGWIAAWAATALLSSFALIFFIFPRPLVGLLVENPTVAQAAVPCLRIGALAQPFMGFSIVLSAALRGAGATRSALAASLLGGLLVRLGATSAFAFGLRLGLFGVWLGSATDWLVRAMLVSWLFARGEWRRIRL